jgi:type IV pilus assembly protein PilM
MKGTVVYLSSEQLVMITAESRRDVLRVENYERLPFPMGAMINGVIINDEAVKEQLHHLKEEGIDEVHLVIDSGQILAKNVVIPKMKMKEIYQFTKDELSPLAQNAEDMIYDFAYLDEDSTSKGASKILALGVERKLIDMYLQLFNDSGIAILSIDFAINALIRFIHFLPGFLDKTYILSQIDGNNLISTLFDNDEYALTYRTRIMANTGTPEFENEVINSISHMIQSSNRSDSSYKISDVFVFGLDDKEEMSLCQNIHDQLHVDARGLPGSKAIYAVKDFDNEPFKLSHYVYPIAMFYKKTGSGFKNKELDLLKAYNRDDEPPKYESVLKLCIPPIIILLVFFIPFGILTWDNMSLQNKIDDVDAEIEKYNLAISATDTSAYEKLSSFQNVLNSIKQLNEQIQSTPTIRDEHITNIQKSLLNGMVLDSINYTRETHTISLSVSSTNVQTIEKYVKNLKKQNDFIAVNYSGYNETTTSSTTQTGEVDPITGLPATNTVESTSYKSTITIILK